VAHNLLPLHPVAPIAVHVRPPPVLPRPAQVSPAAEEE